MYYLYIGYQKSLNFIDAFSCYKQKLKLFKIIAPFNLAHPVYSDWGIGVVRIYDWGPGVSIANVNAV